MEPIAVWVRRDGEWAVVHRCRGCGWLRVNRIAGDDNELVLMSLALKPLARPAFPLDRFHGTEVLDAARPSGSSDVKNRSGSWTCID